MIKKLLSVIMGATLSVTVAADGDLYDNITEVDTEEVKILQGWQNQGNLYYFPATPDKLYLHGKVNADIEIDLMVMLAMHPEVTTIVLDSDGGSLYGGIYAGERIHAQELRTYIPSNAACHSACGIMYLGGRDRSAQGKLGAHRVGYGKVDSQEELPAGEVLNDAQAMLGDVVTYLATWDVPMYYYIKFLNTPHSDMYVFTKQELTFFNTYDEVLADAEEVNLILLMLDTNNHEEFTTDGDF